MSGGKRKQRAAPRSSSRCFTGVLAIPHGASGQLAPQPRNRAAAATQPPCTYLPLAIGSQGTGVPRRRPGSLLALHASDFLLPGARQMADVMLDTQPWDGKCQQPAANRTQRFREQHSSRTITITSGCSGVRVDIYLRYFSTQLMGSIRLFFGTASACTSDPGARIGCLLSHTIRIRKHISRRIMML
jgi:hypothetical protein